jgi:hypothetical protein
MKVKLKWADLRGADLSGIVLRNDRFPRMTQKIRRNDQRAYQQYLKKRESHIKVHRKEKFLSTKRLIALSEINE